MNARTLSLWQASLEAETPRRLTVTAPPVTRTVKITEDVIDGRKVRQYEYEEEEEPPDRGGMNLSAAMIRLIGHDEGYGLAFPVRRALAEWNRYCRSHHQRWPDHATRPVCAELAYAVIRNRYSLAWAAEQSGVSYLRAERLLIGAVREMAAMQERWVWGSD